MAKAKNRNLPKHSDEASKGIISSKEPHLSKNRSSLKSSDHFSYYNEKPSWIFSKCDFGHEEWGFCQNKSSSVIQEVLQALGSFESMTWAEIFQAPKGRRGGSKNHSVLVEKIIKKAQDRLTEMNLCFEELVSLRISGTGRIWGYQEGSKYAVIWHDSGHEICPAYKRHT